MKTDITPAGAKQQAEQTARLAYQNGVTAFRAGRPCKDSNPYRPSRQSHADFIAGWNAAQRSGAPSL